MTQRIANATANPPGTTQTEDGCIVPGTVGRMPPRCKHQGGDDVPQHVEARTGSAGHQRRN